MCSQDGSLKLIAFTSFLIMMVDVIVLFQTLSQWGDIEKHAQPDVFHSCYNPQILMRVIFTLYSINSAFICTLLTTIVASLSEDRFERLVPMLLRYTYATFGPLLLITCFIGYLNFNALLYECELNMVTSNVNYMDIFLIILCTLFSLMITTLYST
jgi:hypothetical protein